MPMRAADGTTRPALHPTAHRRYPAPLSCILAALSTPSSPAPAHRRAHHVAPPHPPAPPANRRTDSDHTSLTLTHSVRKAKREHPATILPTNRRLRAHTPSAMANSRHYPLRTNAYRRQCSTMRSCASPSVPSTLRTPSRLYKPLIKLAGAPARSTPPSELLQRCRSPLTVEPHPPMLSAASQPYQCTTSDPLATRAPRAHFRPVPPLYSPEQSRPAAVTSPPWTAASDHPPPSTPTARRS